MMDRTKEIQGVCPFCNEINVFVAYQSKAGGDWSVHHYVTRCRHLVCSNPNNPLNLQWFGEMTETTGEEVTR